MNEKLLVSGGVINLLVGVFHAFFWKRFNWPESLSCLNDDLQAVMQVLNIHLILAFALVAVTSILHHKEMLSTAIGRSVTGMIVMIYCVRFISEVVFWDISTAKSIGIMIISSLIVLLYLIPLITTRGNRV